LVAWLAYGARAVPSWVDFMQTFLTGVPWADPERHGCRETKRAVPQILARLRIGEIYS
jgi:hypothetical protein